MLAGGSEGKCGGKVKSICSDSSSLIELWEMTNACVNRIIKIESISN